MTSIGWYCIEVTTDEIANQVFLEENIDVNKIDNKIYWLNKQPILAGQKLLFSDWTAINITPSNAKYRMLKAGIYWYQVIFWVSI